MNDASPTTVRLVEPVDHGYLHIGLTSGPWPLPPALPSRRRRAMLAALRRVADELRIQPTVHRTDVFRAILRPPGSSAPFAGQSVPAHLPDAVLLVEADSPRSARRARQHPAVRRLLADEPTAHALVARNVRRIGPVDHERQGVFLFNYFAGDTEERTLDAWHHTAGWFQLETALDNSTVLAPLEPGADEHTLVNHCRWDRLVDVLPSLILKRSFRSDVLRTFARHRVSPRPMLYRLHR